MARLFEHFVRNFLSVERRDITVHSEEVRWIASSEQDDSLSFLPSMRTDITVRDKDRTIVIDTKFYQNTFQSYYDKKSIHSDNLYQLMTYLRNMEARQGADAAAEGMLLYPVTSEPVDLSYVIQGHKVRLRTIDLSQEWRNIAADMTKLI
jgi:5-methylcytosine-specific restriction enzyme subunit McrC